MPPPPLGSISTGRTLFRDLALRMKDGIRRRFSSAPLPRIDLGGGPLDQSCPAKEGFEGPWPVRSPALRLGRRPPAHVDLRAAASEALPESRDPHVLPRDRGPRPRGEELPTAAGAIGSVARC